MRRSGKTKTVTISIDVQAARFAAREAKKHCRGNVSQFFGILLSEAQRFAAMDRVLAGSGHAAMTEEELFALRREVAPGRKRAA
jgi:hypothetical protein